MRNGRSHTNLGAALSRGGRRPLLEDEAHDPRRIIAAVTHRQVVTSSREHTGATWRE